MSFPRTYQNRQGICEAKKNPYPIRMSSCSSCSASKEMQDIYFAQRASKQNAVSALPEVAQQQAQAPPTDPHGRGLKIDLIA